MSYRITNISAEENLSTAIKPPVKEAFGLRAAVR